MSYIKDQMLSEEQLQILQQYKDKERLTPSAFSLKVEKYAHENNESYIDSILYLSDLFDIDYDKTSKMLTQSIKIKLAAEQDLLKTVYNVDSTLNSCFE